LESLESALNGSEASFKMIRMVDGDGYIYIGRDREIYLATSGRIEHESFLLKFNAMTFKYKIHFVEDDLHI